MDVNPLEQARCDHLWSEWYGGDGQWLRTCERCYQAQIAHTEEAPKETSDVDIGWAEKAFEEPPKEHE